MDIIEIPLVYDPRWSGCTDRNCRQLRTAVHKLTRRYTHRSMRDPLLHDRDDGADAQRTFVYVTDRSHFAHWAEHLTDARHNGTVEFRSTMPSRPTPAPTISRHRPERQASHERSLDHPLRHRQSLERHS